MIPNYVKESNVQENKILNNPKAKEELVKIFLQTLQNFGYDKTCDSLQKESGIQIQESEDIVKFRKAILMGTWNKAIERLEQIEPQIQQKELKQAKYLILKEKYLELLELGNSQEALKVIRNEIPQIVNQQENQQQLVQLASYIMIKNKTELRQKSKWEGAGIDSRKQLLQQIFTVLGPQGNMMPPNRLQTIVKQSKTYQLAECQFHTNIEQDFSILNQHQCKKSEIPLKPVQKDSSHQDEVWNLKFSPDGKYLASIGKNASIILWDIIDNSIEKKYVKKNAHDKDINCVNWKHDSTLFGTASSDKTVKIWNPNKKLQCVLTLKDKHTDIIFSVVWNPIFPNIIYTAGIDTYISVYDTKKKITVDQIESQRNLEIHITNDGKYLLSVGVTQNKISIMDVEKKLEISRIEEKDQIQSTYLSRCGKYLLTNISYKKPELKLYNLETLEIINKFSGHNQESMMIKCCLGWKQELIVACGSQDGRIFLWHKLHNKVTKIIKASKSENSTVNCVAWHPTKPNMMVSAHDDHNLVVWSNKKIPLQQQQKEENKKKNAWVGAFGAFKQFITKNFRNQRNNQLQELSLKIDEFDQDCDSEAFFNRLLQETQAYDCNEEEQYSSSNNNSGVQNTSPNEQQQEQQQQSQDNQGGMDEEYDDSDTEMEQEEQKQQEHSLQQQQQDIFQVVQQQVQQIQQQQLQQNLQFANQQQQQQQMQQQQQQQQQEESDKEEEEEMSNS